MQVPGGEVHAGCVHDFCGRPLRACALPHDDGGDSWSSKPERTRHVPPPPSLTILYLQECRNTCGLPLSGVLYWAKGNLLNEDMWVQASLLMAWYS